MAQYPIKYVSRKTGLSPHAIRAWERRYAALTPARSETNRRLYSDEDIERLSLLQRAVKAGQTIGRVAGLSTEQLLAIANGERAAPSNSSSSPAEAEERLAIAVAATERLDSEALTAALGAAAADFGILPAIDRVISPLMTIIGDRWRDGSLRVSQEHMASAEVRTFLGRHLSTQTASERAPTIVLTTPTGQLHELGALMAAVAAGAEGWRVRYLGPNLPVEEIAGAVRESAARVLGLSLVYPPDDPRVEADLVELRRLVGPKVEILAGGRCVHLYHAGLRRLNAQAISSLTDFRKRLEALRATVMGIPPVVGKKSLTGGRLI